MLTHLTDDSSDEDDLIFVAMPGKMLGKKALWKDVDQIKKHLYERVARDVSQATGVDFRVRIEVDHDQTGDIYESMFGAALQARVYIADLTGLNVNVYLELGVRWAMKDNVTVLTCQSLADDRAFNVHPDKAVEYGQDPEKLEKARSKIVTMIVDGLKRPARVDSLVRRRTDLVIISRRELEELRKENLSLHRQRGDDLVAAARAAEHSQRMDLLTQAVAISPANQEARMLLGQTEIAVGNYDKAIVHLVEATRLDPSSALAWQQLGVAQSKHGELDTALDSLKRSAALNSNNAETYSNLGGVYRRKARANYDTTGKYDTVNLRQASDAYAAAGKIDSDNTYPLMNVVRLDLQLAEHDTTLVREALHDVDVLEHLAQFSAKTKGDKDPWKWFDLADALAFNGKQDEALKAAQNGLLKFKEPNRPSAGTSAADPLQDILNQTNLPASVETAVRALVDVYRAAA